MRVLGVELTDFTEDAPSPAGEKAVAVWEGRHSVTSPVEMTGHSGTALAFRSGGHGFSRTSAGRRSALRHLRFGSG
jgi:hypothetical protein